MSQWFQRLRAYAKYGSVNDATIQGYLRAASQLEDVWQQLDDKVDALLLDGLPPWEAYANMGYALAFVRACRMNVVFAQELLKAESAPGNNMGAGYLPRITYEQALALCEHIEPLIEEALKASGNAHYTLSFSGFPLHLGPHVGDASQSFPLSHLQGTINAAQQMRDWTAGLLAKYELAIQASKEPLPAVVTRHLERVKNDLNMGDFHLRTGVDMVGQLSQGQVAEELQRKAEGLLWEAMDSFYTVSQLIAMPGARFRPAPAPRTASEPDQTYPSPKPATHQSETQPEIQASKPKEPDTLSLLKQITAEPESVQRVSSQPAPETIDLLKQVGAGSTAQPREAAQPAPNVAELLSQGEVAHGNAQSTPDMSNMFSQSKAEQGKVHHMLDTTGLLKGNEEASQPASIDSSGLFGQNPEQATKSPDVRDHKTHPRAKSEQSDALTDTTLDLLAEICGDEEKSDA